MTRHPFIVTFNAAKLFETVRFAFVKLWPIYQLRNPVLFVVYVSALLASVEVFTRATNGQPVGFVCAVAGCLWLTVLFANFAEAYAEGRGKAQANILRKARKDILAKRLRTMANKNDYETLPAQSLRSGDLVLISASEFIPADGQVVEGIASVDESAITGESAPVIRESGGDRDAVTGGTRVLSDWIVMRVTAAQGEGYLDRMIAMVEGAKRQKTPNEIALGLLLSAMTLIFLISCATLLPFSIFAVQQSGIGHTLSVSTIVALLVCLAPTTIGGLLSAIGIAGMNRLMSANVIATSGRAVEAAGDINVLLLDKTGTITLGNRQAAALIPSVGTPIDRLVEAAVLSSLSDETPEGKSIVELCRTQYGFTPPTLPPDATSIPFSAETRVSGVTIGSRAILKGASDAIAKYVGKLDGQVGLDVQRAVETIARQGGTPLLVVEGSQVLGVVHLKDIVKVGIKDRLRALRAMGIKSVMVTGDNPMTAAAIASEAGVDDFIAEATPEAKLNYIRKMQQGGELVAMVGDGTNDAPALAQADVALAMNSGTQAAKEAGNMVDLDSNPTKLIEIVEIGKQLLMTRGSLTTFSLANDIAKYFVVIPAVFATVSPALARLDIFGFSSPQIALLSALIFNAFIIVFLIPLAMRGVPYLPIGAERLLKRNLLVYGLGGVITPFIGIKAIGMLLDSALGGIL